MRRRSEPKYIKKLDTFIKHFNDGDYSIKPDASKVNVKYFGRQDTLANFLAESIHDYSMTRTDSTMVRYDNAMKLLFMITHARTRGMIVEGENLISKLKKCEEQNNQLKEANEKLQKENSRLEQLNKALHQTLDKFSAKSSVSQE